MSGNAVTELRTWLTERVAFYLEKSPGEIALDAHLADLGLDSAYAVTLSGDIEDTLKVEVEPTLFWDYPTITALVEHLSAQMEQAA